MLANLRQDGTLIVTDTSEPAVVVSPIAPKSAPAYVPPTDAFIAPNPIIAPPPDGQFRGEGGTPFGSRPSIYIVPIVPVADGGYDLSGYGDVVPNRDKGPVLPNPVLPGRPGDKQTMPVPTGQQPTKPAVAPAVNALQQPGPITGNVAGFDLSRIPFWGWLVGAAFLGSRLLK